jgi:hypothetical protein
MRRYSAFLVRCWRLPDGAERIEVQHIQSGTVIMVASLQAATDWIKDHELIARTPDQSGQRDAPEDPQLESTLCVPVEQASDERINSPRME